MARRLNIGDGGSWTFVNGDWCDGPGNSLSVPSDLIRLDGDGMQGHHYAFLHDRPLGDLRADFEFALHAHSDVGLVFRASHPSRFGLIHFPNCGQASRAQHFWAGLSVMTGDGYLRLRELEMLRRVPSTDGIWLGANIELEGDELRARVGRNGRFNCRVSGIPSGGFIGLYVFGPGEIRKIRVEGEELPGPRWSEKPRQPRNWFHPSTETTHGVWQRPGNLVRIPGGDLLLNYNVQERPYRGKVTPLILRSRDDGASWESPERLDLPYEGRENWGHIHVFPDGEIRMLVPGDDGYALAETGDDGSTWSEPEAIEVGPTPEGVDRLHLGPQALLNLENGGMVMFAYGRFNLSREDMSIFTWGSHHCQAFSCRSTDGGRSWSDWVNLDGARDSQGRPVRGSLDLTEVCGVQTGDGSILAMIRPIYSPWMWETWSHDGGESWTPCVRGPFPGYATPNMLRTESGRILVAHRLPGLTINTSPDDGNTWDRGTMIDSAIWVMGSMLEVSEDLVLYVYYDSFESLMRAQFIRVTEDGLLPGGT